VFAGGNNGSETIGKCFLIDKENGLVIIGGQSNADDFIENRGGAGGFLYAVSFSGNWIWGRQFGGVDDHDSKRAIEVRDIHQCQLEDGLLTVTGTAQMRAWGSAKWSDEHYFFMKLNQTHGKIIEYKIIWT